MGWLKKIKKKVKKHVKKRTNSIKGKPEKLKGYAEKKEQTVKRAAKDKKRKLKKYSDPNEAKNKVDKVGKKVLGKKIMNIDNDAKRLLISSMAVSSNPITAAGIDEEFHDGEMTDKQKNVKAKDVSLSARAVNNIADKVSPDIPEVNIPEAPIYAESPRYTDAVRRNRRRGARGRGRSSTILTGSGGSLTGSTGKTLLGS